MCAVAIVLAACGKEPTGQVVAVVNGEEITQQELNAEIAELPGAPAGDKQAVRRQVLQQIIERRLMSQVAKEDGLDRDPTYIIRERRLKEELLVSMYGAKTADTVRVPDAAGVRKFITENPGRFSERTAYRVDQISFDMPSDPKILKELEADKTLAEVEASLKQFNLGYSKGQNTIDSGNVPPPIMKQILALPAGEPFIIPAQGKIVVSVITGQQPVPVSEQEAGPMAAQVMRAEDLGKLLRKRLDEAKTKANITYQDGFAPVAKKSPTKAATSGS
ncbi:MAG: EpsD family peptidyl-prolyl cis-trans isomerase [Sphingomonadales bacterium]|nr:EpsD family peptidyl-prolyl cis-trans isomerase [Sphingomonadales bacterium]